MVFTNEDKILVKVLRKDVLKFEVISWQAVVAFSTRRTAVDRLTQWVPLTGRNAPVRTLTPLRR